MASLINGLKAGMQWPPKDLARHKIKEHSAWYSGDADLLANFYYDANLSDLLNLNFNVVNRDVFWGRVIKNDIPYYLHVPVAGDLAENSAGFLFGESPIIRFGSDSKDMEKAQMELDKMLTESGFYSKLVEAAELCSALGGIYIKVVYDSEMSEYPMPVIVQPEQAFPIFKFGKLKEVTFVYTVSDDGSTVYRLAERIMKGKIENTLYKGSSDNLGHKCSLGACEVTKGMKEVEETVDALTCVYIPNMLPNKLDRQCPYGRSDYQGIELLMNALDEVYSCWMNEIKIAKGRIHVPESYISEDDDGSSRFDIDKSVYVTLETDPVTMQTPITPTQFEIRSDKYEQTCLNLLERIITSAGYSPQSFGLNIEGRAESGTALNVRERKSFVTTSKKQSHWESGIKHLVTVMCMVKNKFLGGNFTNDCTVNIEFSDSVTNNLSDVSNSVKILSDAKAISTETKVRMIHPEWTDKQIQEEIERINNDGAMGNPLDNPEDVFQLGGNKNTFGGNNEPTDGNVN